MEKIKRQPRRKKKEIPEFPFPLNGPTGGEKDLEVKSHPARIEAEAAPQPVKTILIPKETIFIEEGRFEKPGFIFQTVIASIGLLGLIGFVVYGLLQRADSSDALALARNEAISSDARTRESIGVTKESIDAMRQSFSRQEELMRMEVRSYIGVAEPFLIRIAGGKPLLIGIECQNLGKTAARNVRFRGGMKLGGAGVSASEIGRTLRTTVSPGAVISPGAKYLRTVSSALALTSDDSSGIAAGSKNLFIFGELSYLDVFDSPHVTRFCMKYNAPAETFFTEGKYNDAD